MKKIFAILLMGLTLASCNNNRPTTKELGGIKYSRGSEACKSDYKKHWLLEIEASNAKDSVYLSTIELKRKIEIHILQIDTATSLYTILSETCIGDSVNIIIKAHEFYKSLNGSIPSFLTKEEMISVKIVMIDRLNDLEHIGHKTVFEQELISKYIVRNNWNGIQDSTTEIYFEILKNRDEAFVPFKKAKIKYVIKTLSEQIIAYSKEGDPLVYDVDDKSILKGIRFLCTQMTEGESLRAIIPSEQAFGVEGNSKISGYVPIIVELEFLEIIE